jgi:hypothetical protein
VVTTRARRAPGPTLRALAVLAVSALALIATTPPPPTLQGHVVGSVVLGGGESTQRELRIHVNLAGGHPTSGSITLGFQASNGLLAGSTDDAVLGFAPASDASGAYVPTAVFPVDRCVRGCDLAYNIQISARPKVLPASVIRYEVDVELRYDSGYGSLDGALMQLSLDGESTGPVAPVWSVLAGVLALVLGVAAGPAVDRALGPRRRWPAVALLAVVVVLAWTVLDDAVNVITLAATSGGGLSPMLLISLIDPWSTLLLGALAWGLWRGIRREPTDDGWLLGLAAVAAVGLGGLWLAKMVTDSVVVQPVLLALPFVLLGGLGGVVIGQAWRTSERPLNARWWVALAVVSHGIVMAGFGFVALRPLYGPFADPTVLLLLVPATLVALAFRRWLRGLRGWLIMFDLLIAAVGVLGLWVWQTSFLGFSTNPHRYEVDDIAVYIAVAAALVAVITSFHAMPRGAGGDAAPMSAMEAGGRIDAVRRERLADDPPTR